LTRFPHLKDSIGKRSAPGPVVVSLTAQIGVHSFSWSTGQRKWTPGKTLFLNIVGENTVRKDQPLSVVRGGENRDLIPSVLFLEFLSLIFRNFYGQSVEQN
jgi:hypothetical protein